jgi:hypothetical protein
VHSFDFVDIRHTLKHLNYIGDNKGKEEGNIDEKINYMAKIIHICLNFIYQFSKNVFLLAKNILDEKKMYSNIPKDKNKRLKKRLKKRLEFTRNLVC